MSFVNGLHRPNYTVISTTTNSEGWLGQSYEFFNSKEVAQARYNLHETNGVAIVLRPYYEEHDKQFLNPIQAGR